MFIVATTCDSGARRVSLQTGTRLLSLLAQCQRILIGQPNGQQARVATGAYYHYAFQTNVTVMPTRS
ncbi:MAG: hypothetical protein ACTIKR_00180 [Advenella sp.]|uniref:hypothetical protein n=1 Tax=unclassified Advenella TaxID=2685285 RepID=UPI0018690A8A|nr:hypothetical protein [Advenella sp. FME57]